MLIFNNGSAQSQSVVHELQLPTPFDFNTAPTSVWSFTDANLFSSKVSGAYRTENGNTIITEGDFGYWEVTASKEVVWKYNKGGFFWRGYPYKTNSTAVVNLKN